MKSAKDLAIPILQPFTYKVPFAMFPLQTLFQTLLLFVLPISSSPLNPPQPLDPNNLTTCDFPLTLANGSLPLLSPTPQYPTPPSSDLSKMLLQCDGGTYGQDLNAESCYEAYANIPHVITDITFGPRTQGSWIVNLPWSIYSCELDALEGVVLRACGVGVRRGDYLRHLVLLALLMQ